MPSQAVQRPLWRNINADARLFWLSCIVTIALSFKQLSFNLSTQLLLMINLIIGLPHGASDFLWIQKNTTGMATCLVGCIGYLSVVLLCIWAWVNFPPPALAVFLALSAYHFGQDWENKGAFRQVAAGLSVISIPYMMWPEETLFLFQLITFDHPIHPLITTSLASGFWIGLCWCAIQLQQQRWQYAEVLMLYLIGYILQPLAFFTLYFCSLHSIRHYRLTIKQQVITPSQIYLMFTIAATCVGSIIMISHHQFVIATDLNLTGFATLFIALFALTVPHCLIHRIKSHTH